MSLSVVELIAASLALVISLAWNEFFKSSIKAATPSDSTQWETAVKNFYYAIIITIFVIISYQLYNKIIKAAEDAHIINGKEPDVYEIELKLNKEESGEVSNTGNKSRIILSLDEESLDTLSERMGESERRSR